jgi:ribosomal protein L7Ae-like RNA K-turn-binding protein
VSVTDAPAGAVPEVVRRKVLGLVGLGVRGRLAVVGAEQVREATRKGTVSLALVAQDVSRHTLDKVVPILRAKQVLILEWPSAAELGAVVGRDSTAAIGVVDNALARGIRDAVGAGSVSESTDSGEAARDARRRKG